MKSNEVKAARIRKGYSVKKMSDILGICSSSYYKKERGDIRFSDREKAVMAEELGFSLSDVNVIFFDGMFPNG